MAYDSTADGYLIGPAPVALADKVCQGHSNNHGYSMNPRGRDYPYVCGICGKVPRAVGLLQCENCEEWYYYDGPFPFPHRLFNECPECA